MREPGILEEEALLTISHQVALIIGLCRVIEIDDASAWDKLARDNAVRHDTLTVLLDPTAWQRDHAGVDASAAVADAFLVFRRAIEKAVAT